MTAPPFPLEDFGNAAPEPAAAEPPVSAASPQTASPAPTAEELEAERMAAYEKGYSAGWDDATRAEAEDRSRIDAAFARNLQELGFTFHEARSHVMKALEPLLSEMTGKVLPRLVSETLGETILEQILPLAEAASDTPVQVVISPRSRPAIQRLVEDSVTFPLDIIEEPSLADGQVYLRLGETEKKIDMEAAVEQIERAIRAVYAVNEEVMKHG
ncbi:hypothetical protein [Celeribacter indicus]|uniref:Flagellar biosynthesis protein n=1 Tax=Celeribacter indicus TaxID=1208324 RepID=A0A0B5DX58_9RHOB|nr:hypothetical protein [Celeribacter indicus]AJE44827.1 hypothetical protein P73_0112 [Celeribacter indicus]SDX24121.1 flagellar assembly protein FliH [Celeribacter indicus]